MRALIFAGLLLAGVVSGVHATDAGSVINNASFEDGTLAGWTTSTTGSQSVSYGSEGVGASVVTGMTDFDSEFGDGSGTHSWTVTPYGDYMASLQAGGADTFSAGATTLGLSSDSQTAIGAFLSGTPTDASWMYQDLVLNAGDSFTMAWQYVSTDYEPWNDSSFTSLVNMGDSSALATVNNHLAQYAVLGATNLGTGDYSTGSYGATGWEVATYTVSTGGTYRLGFLSFNLNDSANSPVLLIDQQPGLTFDKGVPFDPIAPNEGSGAPTTPPSSVTIDAPTTTTDLGSTEGTFDGGTLVADGDSTLDQDFTINGNGGTIDQAGHEVVVNGGISDADAGESGSLTIINSGNGGGVVLTATNTYTGTTTIDEGATLALEGDGSIADSAGVTANGTFDVSGANGDADVTTLDGTGTVDLGSNDLNLTDASGTFGGAIGGTGGVNVNGGSESLSGTNTYTGTTTIDDGATLSLTGDGSIADSAGVTANGTFDISGANGGADVTTLDGTGTVELGSNDLNLTDASGLFGGTISGTGGLSVQGGTQVLTGTNTYSGGTTIENGGTLEIGSGSSLGATGSDVTLNDGTLRLDDQVYVSNQLVLDGQGTVETEGQDVAVVAGAVTGEGDFIKDGSGLLVVEGDMSQDGGVIVNDGLLSLTGNNSYTGDTTVNGGWLQIADDANLGAATNDLVLNGGGVVANGTFDNSHDIELQGGGSIETDAGYSYKTSGEVTGTGTLIKYGDGTLTLDGTLAQTGGLSLQGGTTVLSGDNTYGGATTVTNGTLQIDSDGNLGQGNQLSLINGTLHTTGDVEGSRTIGLTGTATFEVDGGTTLAESGIVVGTGTLVKDGAGEADFSGPLWHTGGTVVNDGTLVLSGDNTYTGGTTLNGGVLQVGSDANLGDASGGLTFDGGALHTTGSFGTDRDVTLAGNGTFDTDAGTTMTDGGDVSGSGALIKEGTGTLELDGTLSHSGGTVINDGTLVLTGSNTYTGGTTVNDGTLQISDDANLGDASGNLTFDGGTLHTTDDLGTNRDITLAGNGTIDTDTGTTMTDGGDVNGSGALIKDGEGTLELSGTLSHGGGTTVNDGILVLSGNNTYTGGTTLNGGTLDIGRNANLGATSSGLTFHGGTLHTTQSLTTARQITLAGDAQFDVDTGTTLTATDAIDGNGRLVKQGDGTLVLTGANTYTGGTTIDAGTLQGDSTSLQGDIVDNGTLRFVQAGNGTFGGDISGTGGLVKDGQGTLTISGTASHQGGTTVNAGTLVLTGSNTYTGGTTLNGGTLQVSRDANLGDASSDLTLDGGTLHTTGSFESARDIALGGGSFATDAGTTFTSDGAIDGNGGLVKNGQGTMVVNGVASHQGGTTVNAGVLIFNGANSYTGGTTLNGGSLHVGSDASLGDVSSAITFNGGDLTVTQSMASDRDMLIGAGNASITTLAGVTFTAHGDMSGTGGLVKRGGGTLVVSGNNTFSGGTLIDGGVIRIDSGSSLGTGAILLHGGTLQTVETLGTGQTVLVSGDSGVNVDAGKTAELSGTILTDGDAGCFIKSGKGTLNMTGSATLANGTCVQDGMLRANGELTSRVQVDRPGTLRGVGLVTGSINVEGTLAPGNSPGTLSVAGAVTMHEGSTLEIDIDGRATGTGKGSYSRLLVGGSFTAAGTLAPTLRGITGNASNAFTPALGDVYTVVQASRVQGRFDALLQPTAGLAANTRFQVFYVDGQAVELFVTPVSYATLLDGSTNGNAVRTGEAVDRMVAAQDAGTDSADQHALLFALAGLRAEALPQVVQQLSGETHAQTAAMAREASLGLAGDMTDHLAESSLDQGGHGSRAWATLSQGGYRALGDAQASGFHSQQSRASAGLDAYRGEAVLWGVGLAHTESRLENVPASGNVLGNGVLLYGELAAGPALVDGTASWSKDRWSTRRADPLAASSLTSQADGHSEAASVTARFPLQHEGVRIEPYVQAAWQRISREGFVEAGDVTTRLGVGRYDATGTRLLAGLKLGSTAQDPLATSATWRLGAAVGRDFGTTLDPVVDATLAGESFAVRTPSMGRTLLKLDASATLRLGKQAYLYGGLNSATSQDRAGYGVNAGVRVQF